MRSYSRLISTAALATGLAAALAACGGPAEGPAEDGAAGDADAATAAADDAATTAAAPGEDAGETATVEGAPGETSAPTPSASASTAAPAAPAAAAAPAGPPQAFTTCAVCHSTQRGQNGIGPSLAGIVGRRSASISGFNYSPAMQGANVTWNEATLRRYLADTNGVVPGTLMPPPGLTPAQVNEVVNYLKTL